MYVLCDFLISYLKQRLRPLSLLTLSKGDFIFQLRRLVVWGQVLVLLIVLLLLFFFFFFFFFPLSAILARKQNTKKQQKNPKQQQQQKTPLLVWMFQPHITFTNMTFWTAVIRLLCKKNNTDGKPVVVFYPVILHIIIVPKPFVRGRVDETCANILRVDL